MPSRNLRQSLPTTARTAVFGINALVTSLFMGVMMLSALMQTPALSLQGSIVHGVVQARTLIKRNLLQSARDSMLQRTLFLRRISADYSSRQGAARPKKRRPHKRLRGKPHDSIWYSYYVLSGEKDCKDPISTHGLTFRRRFRFFRCVFTHPPASSFLFSLTLFSLTFLSPCLPPSLPLSLYQSSLVVFPRSRCSNSR